MGYVISEHQDFANGLVFREEGTVKRSQTRITCVTVLLRDCGRARRQEMELET